jgi:NAD(P)H-hydrate repair Nnr-like enzyme with NAD(P)H-hydrate dehydratase domain
MVLNVGLLEYNWQPPAVIIRADRERRMANTPNLTRIYTNSALLKGSGSIIAAPGRTPHINPTGNALLAVAGTGDVLAGMAGAALAHTGSAWEAACHACYRHGALADHWSPGTRLTAGGLLDYL